MFETDCPKASIALNPIALVTVSVGVCNEPTYVLLTWDTTDIPNPIV